MKFKRFSCLFLALILMLSIAPFSAFAVETDGAETFEINLFDALAINQRSNVADFVFDAATNTVTFTKTAGVDKNAYVGYDIYLPAGTYYLTAENVVSTVDNTASWKLNRGSVEVDFGHLKAAPSDGDKTVNVEESGTYSIRISARYADPEGTAYTISKIKFVPVNPEFEFDVTNLFDVTKIAHQSQVADFVRDAATSTVEFTKTASGFKNAYVGYSCYLPAGTYYLTADTVASTAVSTENTASWKLNLGSKEVDGGHLTVSPNEGEKTVNIEKDGTYSVRISARYADPSGTEYTISNIKLVSADQPYGPNLFDVSKITQESEVSDFAIDPNTNTVSFTKTASGFNNAYVGYDIELSAGTYYLTADTVMSTAASTENTASWKLNRGSVEVDNGHLRDSASELEKTVNVEESGVYSIRISARYADPRGTEYVISNIRMEAKPADHAHSYAYSPNEDGTHNGACECGKDAIVNEDCDYGEDTICDKCGYDNHEHAYEYTSNDDGTHNGACACGEDAISNEACAYGEDAVCDKCGYKKLETISGTVIRIDDVDTTYTPAVQLSSDTVTDFSSVSVTVAGKNLFNACATATLSNTTAFNVTDIYNNTIQFTKNNGASTGAASVDYKLYLPAGTYYLTANASASDGGIEASWVLADANGTQIKQNNKNVQGTLGANATQNTFTITESGTYTIKICGKYAAAKGTVYTVSNIQLEYGHVSEFAPFTKNLLDASKLAVRESTSNLSVINANSNTVTFTKTNAASSGRSSVSCSMYLPAGTYYLTGIAESSDGYEIASWVVLKSDGKTQVAQGTIGASVTDEKKSFTIETSGTYNILICGRYAAAKDTVYTVSNLQLECGQASEFTPYASRTVTANADGTVSGIDAASPMTLFTDSDVTISCEYQKKN